MDSKSLKTKRVLGCHQEGNAVCLWKGGNQEHVSLITNILF